MALSLSFAAYERAVTLQLKLLLFLRQLVRARYPGCAAQHLQALLQLAQILCSERRALDI